MPRWGETEKAAFGPLFSSLQRAPIFSVEPDGSFSPLAGEKWPAGPMRGALAGAGNRSRPPCASAGTYQSRFAHGAGASMPALATPADPKD